ncbi:hypothetical protein LRY65_03820 [Candidatus Woesebacteria bacterium]|nr:hypothetical protein [Candidatus Woesebacteria bacterium]MCD8527310.1 hypothetical protein [Candidatus Woesebacteria bacterium]
MTGEIFTPDGLGVFYRAGLKASFLVAFALYVVFAIVVIRQVFLMEHTINTPLHFVLKVFAIGHLIVSLFVFLLAFLVL